MILEIEYFKGDILLFGKPRNAALLRKQLSKTENLCDKAEDNFTELLCRLYGWTVLKTDGQPDETPDIIVNDYIYDRDIQKLIRK